MLKKDFIGYAVSKKNGNPLGIVIGPTNDGCTLVEDLVDGTRFQLHKDDIGKITDNYDDLILGQVNWEERLWLATLMLSLKSDSSCFTLMKEAKSFIENYRENFKKIS